MIFHPDGPSGPAHLALTLGGSGGSGEVSFANSGDWLRGSGRAVLAITDGGKLEWGRPYTVFHHVTTKGFTFAGVTYDGKPLQPAQYAFAMSGKDYRITLLSKP